MALPRKEKCADCSSSGLSMAPNRVSAGSRSEKDPVSWFEIQYLVREIAKKIRESGKKYDCILGITRGGVVPARLLAEELGIDKIMLVPVRKKKLVASEMPPLDRKERYLIVDDIYDTGETHAQVAGATKGYKRDFAFCIARYENKAGIAGRVLNHNRWIVFPWEKEMQ